MKPDTLTDDLLAQLSRIPASEAGFDLSRFPDFLLIGPQRTGTTWLHHHLFRHPSLFLPRQKETYFFSRLEGSGKKDANYSGLEEYLRRAMSDSPRDWIRKSFHALRQSQTPYRPIVRGESTATYAILEPEIIREICLLNPDLKAIMMLRDPLERAWSHARKDLFWHGVPAPEEFPLEDFQKFCRASGQTQLARYSEIAEKWRSFLKPGHLFIGRFADISERPEATLESLHCFLGVPAGRQFMDRSKLEKRINPAPEVSIPPAALSYLREQLAEMIADYESMLADLAMEDQEMPT